MSNKNVPPAFLSFVKKSNSIIDESSDDDRALLLPSHGSSFNLTGDSELLAKKSGSHHSSNSNVSSPRRQRCKGKTKSKRQQQQLPRDDFSHSSSRASSASHLSVHSSTSVGSHRADGGSGRPGSCSDTQSPSKYPHRKSSLSVLSNCSGGDFQAGCSAVDSNTSLNKSLAKDDSYYSAGYDSDNLPKQKLPTPLTETRLSPIAGSTGYRRSPQSHSSAASDNSSYNCRHDLPHNVPESNESIHSSKSMASGYSSKSRKSHKSATGSSNKSMKSSRRRRRSRREEKFREWQGRRRKRQIMVGFPPLFFWLMCVCLAISCLFISARRADVACIVLWTVS